MSAGRFLTEAWIEIQQSAAAQMTSTGRFLTEAWIEMPTFRAMLDVYAGRFLTEAWIEMWRQTRRLNSPRVASSRKYG